ncbi:hypothetical protein [Lactobacillus sp. PV034]|uniref:hypothetical protein n=1 Tax=Lactobacillus sp. PV034 TaxID=2594495 RepID=UPI00223FB562|nr:hypothetical protein [Lactobacillus sp. PV034]
MIQMGYKPKHEKKRKSLLEKTEEFLETTEDDKANDELIDTIKKDQASRLEDGDFYR